MNAEPPSLPPPERVSQTVEHLFRHEGAKMVATLTGIFGVEHLTLAEDVVQEALSRALQTWPFYGVPENPAAWIMRTSRNLALDAVRRQQNFREKEAEIIHAMERDAAAPDGSLILADEIGDDRLRMMFVCCHPAIPADAQVALALKTLCGFGVSEIARAFLSTEAAVAKRLTRAKQSIAEAGVRFEIPAGPELGERLAGVLRVIYLLFNEGYKASAGDRLIREDICEEAIRLGGLLVNDVAGDRPETHALLALMLLNSSRTPARLDEDGNLLRLRDQDRSRWNAALIGRGMLHLMHAAAGGALSEYHLQAGIAACHCTARDYACTDWAHIVALYDRLLQFDGSPVVALNRAVAVGEWQGPRAGIAAVNAIPEAQSLAGYYLFHAVMGDFEWQLGRLPIAAAHFQRALALAELKSEQAFLEKRLRECAAGAAAGGG